MHSLVGHWKDFSFHSEYNGEPSENWGQRADIIHICFQRLSVSYRGARPDGGRQVKRLLQSNCLLDRSSWMSQRYLKLNERHLPPSSPQKPILALLHCSLS